MVGSGARWSRTQQLLLVLLLVNVAVVRWIALGTELWLDEVWSWRLALEEMGSWTDLFGSPRLRWDNNHPLNTAFIHLVGPHQDSRVYRLLAWASGVATVAAAAWITTRRSWATRWTTLLLVAFSVPLTVFSSEARGYAPAVLLALVALGLQRLALERPRWWRSVPLQLCVVLGYLSHLSFVFVHLGLIAWSAWRLVRDARGQMLRTALRLGGQHGAAALFLGFYWLHVRRSLTLPGPDNSIARVLLHTLGDAAGVSPGGAAGWVAAAIVVAGFAGGLVCIARQKDDEWVFHLTAVVLAPALILAVLRPATFYGRYFLVCLPLLYLVLGRLAGELAERSRLAGLCVGLLVLLAVTGGLVQTRRFLAVGRGRYREALLEMASRTAGAEIRVGSNNDACVADVLRFYSRYLPPHQHVLFTEGGKWVGGRDAALITPARDRPLPTGERGRFRIGAWPPGGPDWLVVPSSEPVPARLPVVRAQHGVRCLLKSVFPTFYMTGQTWYLYRCP